MLQPLNQFEEWNRSPKKLWAKYMHADGRQWWLTLTLVFNKEAERQGTPCVENQIYALKGISARQEAITALFKHAVDFSKIPYLDNTITRVRLLTNVQCQSAHTPSASVPDSLRRPLLPYLEISLERLECFVDEDDKSAIPYPSLESVRTEYPYACFIQLGDLSGIEHNESRLHRGVYKVFDTTRNVWCVYKEPTCPADIKSQLNEIESLMRLSKSPRVIQLLGLVISPNPYRSCPNNRSPLVVRGILLQYASHGSLGHLLELDSLNWSLLLL